MLLPAAVLCSGHPPVTDVCDVGRRQDIESREEGGTPGIVESIRAGLVLQLKEALGPDRIRNWDDAIVR